VVSQLISPARWHLHEMNCLQCNIDNKVTAVIMHGLHGSPPGNVWGAAGHFHTEFFSSPSALVYLSEDYAPHPGKTSKINICSVTTNIVLLIHQYTCIHFYTHVCILIVFTHDESYSSFTVEHEPLSFVRGRLHERFRVRFHVRFAANRRCNLLQIADAICCICDLVSDTELLPFTRTMRFAV
jgi:hypothetical protein